MSDPQAVIDLLHARAGVLCAVGAGGKKSLMRWLAAHHPGPVALTATVHTAPPMELPPGRVHLGAADEIEAWLGTAPAPPVAFAGPPEKPGRWSGLPPASIGRLHAAGGFALTLVKADGARMRLIKAPRPDEPPIPDAADTVVPLVSARAIGRPLDERTAHRPERLAPLIGAEPGETLTPDHLARLLASPQGALQGTGEATVVPVINMVDDGRRHALARQAAEAALAATGRFRRVLLMRLDRSDALVEVIGEA